MPSEDTRTQMLRRWHWLLLLQRGIAAIVGLLLPQESKSTSMAGMKPPSWTMMGHWGKREWRADHAPSSPTSASCLLPYDGDDDDGEEGGRKRGCGCGKMLSERGTDDNQGSQSSQPRGKGSSQARQPAPALDAALSGATSQAARGAAQEAEAGRAATIAWPLPKEEKDSQLRGDPAKKEGREHQEVMTDVLLL